MALTLRAGPAALDHIERSGLKPVDLKLIAGGGGGDKWMVVRERERFLVEHWLPGSARTLDLVGSSIGAWRFAAGMLQRSERFFELYMDQRYSDRPGRPEITATAAGIMRELLGADGAGRVLDHPRMRLAVMTARCRGPLGSERRTVLWPGLLAAALANLVRPRWQQLAFVRHLFADRRILAGGAPPRWAQRPGWRLEATPLSRDNLGPALMASGSIPLVLEGVRDIPGAPAGIYRDGGITDYHMPLGYPHAGDIVLFPHFSGTLKAGWFDKPLRWRHLRAALLDNVLLAHPSDEFIAALPHRKIPDRHDFANFSDGERLRYWGRVVAESRRLVDEFSDWLDRGCPLGRVEPL